MFVFSGCGGGGGGGGSTDGTTTDNIIAFALIAEGNNQTATVGTELENPLLAVICNSEGQPIVGQTVTFKVVTGGGSVFAGAATSDADGIVRERWTLGTTAGPQTVEVRAVNSRGEAITYSTFNALAVADSVQTIEASSGDNQIASQLQLLPTPIKVIAKDIYGNPKAGVSVVFNANNGGSATPESVVTNLDGEAQTLWSLGLSVGNQTLNASVEGFTPLTFHATATLDISSPPQNIEIVSGNFQTVAQNSLINPFEVLVTNALGNPVNAPIIFTTTTATGDAYLSPVTVGAIDGIASWGKRFPADGEYQVTASVEGVTPVTFTITVTPSTLFLYDGNYSCNSIQSFSITEGSVNDDPTGGIPFIANLNTENGHFTATYGLNVPFYYDGWLTVDSNYHATAEGTYYQQPRGGGPQTSQGNWSCTRE